MNRLTHFRVNGIKSGHWSPCKKQELVDRLAAYEDTGLEPEEIRRLMREPKRGEWERIPYSFAGGYRCSCCGTKTLEKSWSFCPECGADMRGEKNADKEK